MTMQANIPPVDVGMPLFNLGALFSRRQSPESSWRYEPPSMLPSQPDYEDSSPPPNSTYSAYAGPRSPNQSAPLEGFLEPAMQHVPRRRAADVPTSDHLPASRLAFPSRVSPEVAETDHSLPPPKHVAEEGVSNAYTEANTTNGAQTQRRDYAQAVLASAGEDESTLEKLRVLEERLGKRNSPKKLAKYLDSWLAIATALENENRLFALRRLCEKGYALRGYVPQAEKSDDHQVYRSPDEYKAAVFTLYTLESLVAQEWPLETILSWLNHSEILLPYPSSTACTDLLSGFLDQLDLLFSKYNTGPRDLAFLHTKLLCTIPPVRTHKFGDCTWPVLRRARAMMYRAELGSVIHQNTSGLKRQEIKILSELANLLAITATKPYQPSDFINAQLIDCLTRLRKAKPRNLKQLAQNHILPLLPSPLVNIGMEILLPRASAGALTDAATRTKSEQQTATSTASFADMDILSALEFHTIFHLAHEAHVLPPQYHHQSLLTLYPHRAALLHQLAFQYSIEKTRSFRQNQRSLIRILRYLRRYDFPVGPLLSKSLVKVFITQPMEHDAFVSARRMLWVCRIVEAVEGGGVARNIARECWEWKGEVIAGAQRRKVDLGLGGQARVGILKRLGVGIR